MFYISPFIKKTYNLVQLQNYIYAFYLISSLMIAACSHSGVPADDKSAATRIIENTLPQITPMGKTKDGSRFVFSIHRKPLDKTENIDSQKTCEGSVGSILPPLYFTGCGGAALTIPTSVLRVPLMSLLGVKEEPDAKHIYLSGIERFFVQQHDDRMCWVASLETIRNFLNLPYKSQNEIFDLAQSYCPKLQSQLKGADAYQIVFTISKLLKLYDHGLVHPSFCDSEKCIIDSIKKGHPVIMLKSSHAYIIVGVDYISNPAYSGGKFIPVVRNFRVLDPKEETAEIKDMPPFSVCGADVVISY